MVLSKTKPYLEPVYRPSYFLCLIFKLKCNKFKISSTCFLKGVSICDGFQKAHFGFIYILIAEYAGSILKKFFDRYSK